MAAPLVTAPAASAARRATASSAIRPTPRLRGVATLARGARWGPAAPFRQAQLTVTGTGTHRRPRLSCRTAQTSSGVENIAADAGVREAGAGAFVWTKQWWPVAVLEDLDASRPHAVQLMGERLVLWCDGEGKWQCFEDRCPHRLAPLSEGRLEGGNLSCAYHGWEFSGSGACQRIPQADSPEKAAAACNNPRSCAKRHPTQVRHGLLFAWGESGPTAELEAMGAPVPVMKELDEDANRERLTIVADWFTSIVPYSYDTLCENVLDPSHVPFSHHGVQGKRENGKAIGMSLEGSVTVDEGFVTRQPGGGSITFRPPGIIHYRGGPETDGLSAFNMMIYAVPLETGFSRLMFCVATTRKSRMLKLLGLVPRWVQHLPRMEVLAGDGIFLHAQERELRRLQPASEWNKQFYMPAMSDTGVVAFRRWYHGLAGEVGYAPGVSPELPPLVTDRRVLNDRWGQHSKHCPSCRGAHRTMGKLQVAAGILAAVLLLAAAAALGAGPGAGSVTLFKWTAPAAAVKGCALAAGAALSALSIHLLGRLRQKLVFMDYVHAERD
mmetsp:Transcript_48018/g.121167  ORF Transcript_48018/g.121167 Transcript_48018/m.121167 type:complete len:553 (+) Transcript_48018:475-2133(+)